MAQLSGSHITEMQLFHELKQRFPNIPDRLVTHCIKQTRGDGAACRCILEAETLLSSYRMSGGRRRSEERSGSAPGGSGRRRSPSPAPKPRRPPITRVTSMPDIKPLDKATRLLIQDQLARKKKLELELERDKERLENMRKDALVLERELKARLQAPSHASKVRRLREEIATLHRECNRLASEVDSTSNNGVPLGETSVEFYRNIYPGQRGTFRANPSRHRERRRGGEEGGGPQWRCHMCTFHNHPLLDKCEGCDMPRLLPPPPPPPPPHPPTTATLDAGETQNIHIHVTHRNYPSCKVVHSWVI